MKISVKKMALAMALTAMPMMGFAGNKGPEWLSKAVAYQIYPSSYQDSDGDGIGDIPGITSRLDYIKGLGVNVIWLNPVFVSGWFDGGYDIIDFYKVDPRFGTNTDLVKLIDEAHKRGIRVLLDLVAGHSSDQCQWFKESAQGTDMRYSDYYIWSNEIPQKEVKIIAERKLEADPAVSKRGKWVEADAPSKILRKELLHVPAGTQLWLCQPRSKSPMGAVVRRTRSTGCAQRVAQHHGILDGQGCGRL